MWRRAFFGLVIILAAASPVAARSAGGWKSHVGSRFSLKLPASWADAGDDRARIRAKTRRLLTEDPELARTIDGLLAAGRANPSLKLLAFDFAPSSLRSGFATNLNVLRDSTELGFAEWGRRSLRALAATSFVRKPIWSQTVRLRAGKALRIRYRARFTIGTRRVEASITQYGIVKPGYAYVLTYTTLPSLSATYRATFEQSARSFHIG